MKHKWHRDRSGGREIQEGGDICTHTAGSVLFYSRNRHNIVKQLYYNKKRRKKAQWLIIQIFHKTDNYYNNHIISSVQLLSHVQFFVTPWTAACQASLSITNSWTLLKLMSIESVMPSNHLILCRPLLLLPSIFPSIRVFYKESVLCIRWPKY